MAVIATWRDKSFSVDVHKIYSFTNMQIKTGLKTDDTDDNMQLAQKRKNVDAATIQLDVPLSGALGVSVPDELQSWTRMATDGVPGRFLLGGKDVLGVDLMLKSCTASNLQILPNGTIHSCKLKLEFVQGGGDVVAESDGSGGGSGGGSGKAKKKKIVKTIAEIAAAQAAIDANIITGNGKTGTLKNPVYKRQGEGQ